MKLKLFPGEKIKSIEGYKGLYSVTNFGRIWSYKNNIFLKELKQKDNYLYIFLYKNGKRKKTRINRLVAEHFISNLNNLPEVNHKDGNKCNNYYSNLEWKTKDGNLIHAMINGLHAPSKINRFFGVYNDKFIYKKVKNRKIRYIRNKPWIVKLTVNKKKINLGRFKTNIEGAKAYDNYIIKNNINRPLNNIKDN